MPYTEYYDVIVNKISKSLYDQYVAEGIITTQMLTQEVWIFTDDQYVSAEDIAKLAGIEAGAEINIIEGVQVNGVDLPINAKKVNIVVPTKTSDLVNDSGFITKDVSNLTNYTLKDDVGHELAVSIDPITYVMTLQLKNEAGDVISSGSVDLPLETMVIGATYLGGVLTLTLKNGQTVNVDISALISGLVPDTRKVNGKALSADITLSASDVNAYSKTEADNLLAEKANASDLAAKADASEIPSKLSDLTNDLDLSAYDNKIEVIKVNGVNQTIGSDKSVNIVVPSHANKAILDATTASYTTEEKSKLDGVEAGAEANVIEQIKVNGSAVTVDSNKSVNITIPDAYSKTEVVDLLADKADVDELDDYALKAEVPVCKTRIWS